MATEADPPRQRTYQAPCPNCGAPVEFRSAASSFAVCGFCRSTLVREGTALRRIGQVAEVFDDHSPLQLGASGRYQGEGFALVGRLQYRYAQGTWNEWHALFDNGRSGWLSEDNGGHVFAFEQPLLEGDPVMPAERLAVGSGTRVGGHLWMVASVTSAQLSAAQGELPRPPQPGRDFKVADLRSSQGEVGTLDYADAARPRWFIGRAVALADLALVGLKDGGASGGAGEKTLQARSLSCPNCGAALEVRLSTTQTLVCHQCHSVVDVSQGLGADVHHYAQDNGSEPQIPLGSVGRFAFGRRGSPLLPWQVVGYVERCEVPDEGDGDGEQSFWREYLLYHGTAGFAFLVDADDGWSWTIPLTGAPQAPPNADKVTHEGTVYRKRWDYIGRITYVLGEFYWRLERGQTTFNTDYQAGSRCLNREFTEHDGEREVVWSAGETLPARAVSDAFRLSPDKRALLRRDVSPTASGGGSRGWLAGVFFWAFVFAVVWMLFRCGSSSSDCSGVRNTYGESSAEYQNCLRDNRSSGRTGGGSFGGFSTGGGHK